MTSAELPPDEKNAMSHRGQAARKAREILKEMARGDPTALTTSGRRDRRDATASAGRCATCAISRHGPLQLPLPLLHAARGLRRRLRVPAARRDPDASRRSRGSRACSRGIGVRKVRLTGGEPLLRARSADARRHARRDRRTSTSR